MVDPSQKALPEAENFHGMVPHLLLFLLKFSLSAAVETEQLSMRLIHNKGGIILGVCCQFVILPIAGFLSVLFLKLPVEIGVALIVVTNSPGGSYSNWWCAVFNADLAMSVAMTAISTIVGLLMLPLNLYIFTQLLYSH